MADLEKLMTKAFRLAKKGLGYTSPNPPVGAIVIKDGQIVGQGYHRRAGLPHAEIEALRRAGENSRGGTLITTLEPCSHHGKTPPCADAIISAGVTRVVSAITDANPIVSGNGFRKLINAGVEVIDNVLVDYASEFYRPYFKFITTGRPFVTLKFAQSIDGRIATSSGHSQWISSQESLLYSHRLRAINDAILVGKGTLKNDNPRLTTRLVKGRNPIRIILSKSGKLPKDRHVFTDGESPTYLATSAPISRNSWGQFQVIRVRNGSSGLDLRDLLTKLCKMGVMTLLVEGGSGTLTSFLKQRQADKIIICIAPIIIGNGVNSVGDLGVKKLGQSIRLEKVTSDSSGPDLIVNGYPVWR